ncbi:MAG: ECF transporter S component [Ruminococcus sp.]|nr:ECF transporter S component [Ruminococcus sp.]
MTTNQTAGKTASNKTDIKKLTVLAMFIALGYICLFLFRFRAFDFLTLDFKDVFITMAGFVYGPVAALSVAFVEALLELITVSSTGFWGALMNFAGSAMFACTASLIYKYNKNFKGAVLGLVASVFSMTAVMLIMNLLVTPIYAHTDMKTVAGMIPGILLPFNLVKGILNAAFTFILYKPMTQALRSIRVIPKSENSFVINKRSAISFAVAAAVIIGSVVVLLTVFHGQFEVVKSAH